MIIRHVLYAYDYTNVRTNILNYKNFMNKISKNKENICIYKLSNITIIKSLHNDITNDRGKGTTSKLSKEIGKLFHQYVVKSQYANMKITTCT